MAQDTQKLRELLSQYIGDVYAEALQYTNDPAAAKEVTRRVMTLLKRSQEAGLAVNPSMAKRLTEDCCREREYYENRRATFVNGTIADMPDFDTALSEISPAEVQARARSEAETKAAEAHAAIRAAEAMGAKAYRVTQKEELEPVLREAISLNIPVVIDCQIGCDDKVFPMVSPGAPIADAFDDTDLKIG